MVRIPECLRSFSLSLFSFLKQHTKVVFLLSSCSPVWIWHLSIYLSLHLNLIMFICLHTSTEYYSLFLKHVTFSGLIQKKVASIVTGCLTSDKESTSLTVLWLLNSLEPFCNTNAPTRRHRHRQTDRQSHACTHTHYMIPAM